MFEHGVEHGQQFAHTGDQRHFAFFSAGTEALIRMPDNRITAGGHQGRHVEGRAHGSAATPTGAGAAHRPTITVEGGDPHQGRDLATRQGAHFRQLRHERAAEDGADARHALQQVGLCLPHGALPNARGEVGLQDGHLLGQPGDMGLNPGPEGRCGLAQAVAFGGEHLDHLPTPGQQDGQFRGGRIGLGPDRGLHPGGKQRQHLRIQGIRLRQLAQGLGKIPHLPRIHDNHRQACFHQGPHHGQFITARGFDDDPRGGQRPYSESWWSSPAGHWRYPILLWRHQCQHTWEMCS